MPHSLQFLLRSATLANLRGKMVAEQLAPVYSLSFPFELWFNLRLLTL